MTSWQKKGATALFLGWLLLMFVCIGGAPVAAVIIGRYTPGLIHVRPWMAEYNTIVSGAHLFSMSLVCLGTLLLLWPFVEKILVRSALTMLFLSLLSVAGLFLFPRVYGWGPWLYDAFEVSVIRLLVLLPATLRSVGWGLLTVAVIRYVVTDRSETARLRDNLCLLMIAADTALAFWKWAITPKAVIVLPHLYQPEPLLMAAWALGGLFFLVMIWRVGFGTG